MTRWGKAIDPEKVWQSYPRPQLVRDPWTNLNGLWDYAIAAKEAARPAKWDGKILVPFCIESSLSGVGKRVDEKQALWYRRTLKTQAPKGIGNWLLHFGAVDWHCKVWIDGKLVGEHKGGFDPFSFDVSRDLKPDGEHEIVLWVWDPTDKGSQPVGKQLSNPHGIWYTPVSGIWQTVWLEPVPETRVSRAEFEIDFAGKKAIAKVPVEGRRTGDKIVAKVSRGGNLEASVAVDAGEDLPIDLPKAIAWTPEAPTLYDVTLEIQRGSTVIDLVKTYFAFRKVSYGKDDLGRLKLLLNDKPLFQFGPLDQGWWPDGLLTPPSEEAMLYDVQVLKKLGMNMIRKHIKIEPARYYYDCDRLGMLVWQDMPSAINRTKKHFVAPDGPDAIFDDTEKAIYRTELKAMIDHLRFFPCIYCWVPFNEGWGQHDTNAILNWTMKYDPTRLVDGPSGWTDRGVGHMIDAHIYPGPGMIAREGRVPVLGEYGGLGLPVQGHLWKDSDNWGYRTYKTEAELRENYRRLTMMLNVQRGRGLAAAIYTQTTDVEIEVNGYMTYDREVMKFDIEETAKWHKRLFDANPPMPIDVLPNSQSNDLPARTWQYTIEKPAEGWQKPDFKGEGWKSGPGGFGTRDTPGTNVRTEWKTKDIWMRQNFDLTNRPTEECWLSIHHDEDAEIYINGVLAAKVEGYTTGYGYVSMSKEAAGAMKKGSNTIAVHCKQTGGGQYIDVGIVAVK
jgi:hypothetical protein